YEGGDEYGNPNIDPKSTPEGREAANDADNQGGRPPGSKAADNLIVAQLRAVVTSECNDVRRAATGAKNFIEWVDKYYGVGGRFWSLVEKVLVPTSDAVCELLDGYRFDTEAWAMRHAAESKRLLFKLSDQTTAERLPESVKEECKTWSARAT